MVKEYVVFCEDDSTYWCGLNTWDKQLRKAKIFHSLKYVEEVYKRHKGCNLKTLEIRIELAPQSPTNADHIRSMSDEELAEFLNSYKFCYICEEGCEDCHYNGECERRLAEWLKQPYKEEEE